jgi:hypothetical protein
VDSEEKANAAIAGPTILVLIQTCLLDTTFDYDKVFWGPSGPDALIRVIASTPAHVARASSDQTNRFDMDIDMDAWAEWEHILRFELPPLTPLLHTSNIDSRVDSVYHAFNEACKATMKTVGAAPGFNSRWWNDECKAAAKATRGASGWRKRLAKPMFTSRK